MSTALPRPSAFDADEPSTTHRGSLRSRIQVVPVVVLTLVWVLLWGSYTVVSVLGGVLLAVVLLLLYPLPPLHLGVRIRPWHCVTLVARFAADLVVASLHVAVQSVSPRFHPRGHLVTVPLRTNDDLFAVITAEMTALVPGTVVVDVDPDHQVMTLHVFDIADEDVPAVVRKVQAQEARVLRALSRDAAAVLGEGR